MLRFWSVSPRAAAAGLAGPSFVFSEITVWIICLFLIALLFLSSCERISCILDTSPLLGT